MIAIVDYKAGNLRSVELAVQHFGAACKITRDPEFILSAERIIVPGDGAAESAMQHLNELGLVQPLREVLQRGAPLLGICIGCQMMLAHSEEDGGVDCLGFLPGNVIRFQPKDKADEDSTDGLEHDDASGNRTRCSTASKTTASSTSFTATIPHRQTRSISSVKPNTRTQTSPRRSAAETCSQHSSTRNGRAASACG
jgi:hypothetical protein